MLFLFLLDKQSIIANRLAKNQYILRLKDLIFEIVYFIDINEIQVLNLKNARSVAVGFVAIACYNVGSYHLDISSIIALH
jgi:hypothetical protein